MGTNTDLGGKLSMSFGGSVVDVVSQDKEECMQFEFAGPLSTVEVTGISFVVNSDKMDAALHCVRNATETVDLGDNADTRKPRDLDIEAVFTMGDGDEHLVMIVPKCDDPRVVKSCLDALDAAGIGYVTANLCRDRTIGPDQDQSFNALPDDNCYPDAGVNEQEIMEKAIRGGVISAAALNAKSTHGASTFNYD